MVDVLNMPVNIQYVSDTVIDKVHKIKDLGIVFDCRLKFGEHIDEKINRAYQMIGIIQRNFITLLQQTVLWYCINL